MAIPKVYDQANKKPNPESDPIREIQFSHHIQAAEQSQYRDQGKVLPVGPNTYPYRNSDKDPHGYFIFK